MENKKMMEVVSKFVSKYKSRPILNMVKYENKAISATSSEVFIEIKDAIDSDMNLLLNPLTMEVVDGIGSYPSMQRIFDRISDKRVRNQEIKLDKWLKAKITDFLKPLKKNDVLCLKSNSQNLSLYYYEPSNEGEYVKPTKEINSMVIGESSLTSESNVEVDAYLSVEYFKLVIQSLSKLKLEDVSVSLSDICSVPLMFESENVKIGIAQLRMRD